MRTFGPLLLLITVLYTVSCSDCTNCTPFTEEPYLRINFLNEADKSARVITIDSVNQIYAKELRHFLDTTNTFRFPLDMHNDTSIFNIVYRDAGNLTTYLNNTITIVYAREFLHRVDNYIVVECDIIEFSSDFAIENIKCKESSNPKCISNEALANIYN